MKKKALNVPEEKIRKEEESVRTFEPPVVATFSGKEIIEEIGPAQMCSPSPCPLSP